MFCTELNLNETLFVGWRSVDEYGYITVVGDYYWWCFFSFCAKQKLEAHIWQRWNYCRFFDCFFSMRDVNSIQKWDEFKIAEAWRRTYKNSCVNSLDILSYGSTNTDLHRHTHRGCADHFRYKKNRPVRIYHGHCSYWTQRWMVNRAEPDVGQWNDGVGLATSRSS